MPPFVKRNNRGLRLIVVLLLLTVENNYLFVHSFVSPWSTSSHSPKGTIDQKCPPLYAKTRQKKNKTGRRGRRGSQSSVIDEKVDEQSGKPKNQSTPKRASLTGKFLRQPNKTKKCWVRLDGPSPPLDVCLIEINDASWWEQANNVNPFGARTWPPSLALAKFLAKYPVDETYNVVEVGCGTGLISMVAAGCGATAVATDVSHVALNLVKAGWSETSLRLQKSEAPVGNLTVSYFDLFSNNPLPFPETIKGQQSSSSILVASAVLYDKTLGKSMAKRIMEACEKGAWVILADDDTGLRDGGRTTFEAKWAELMDKKGVIIPSTWTHETVQQRDVFGWADKKVQLLHLNHPPLPGVLE